MTQLIIIPELVEKLLFLHVGGKLLLLYTGAAALKVEDVAVALLGVLVVFGAAALKLQLSGRDIGDLALYGGDLFIYPGKLRLLLLLARAEVRNTALMRLDKASALLTVAGEAGEKLPELCGAAVGCACIDE